MKKTISAFLEAAAAPIKRIPTGINVLIPSWRGVEPSRYRGPEYRAAQRLKRKSRMKRKKQRGWA